MINDLSTILEEQLQALRRQQSDDGDDDDMSAVPAWPIVAGLN
jgi:hypothetical protein